MCGTFWSGLSGIISRNDATTQRRNDAKMRFFHRKGVKIQSLFLCVKFLCDLAALRFGYE